MSNMPLANWNGEIMPLDQVRVSVLDRAFLFGDAVYEALRAYSGRLWLRTGHMARLARSLREMRIETDLARLERRMDETLAHSGVKEGIVYIQVTRGAALRTHAFPNPPAQPNELIYVQAYPEQSPACDPYAAERAVGTRVITHPDLRWKRCDIKSVNLLGNVLANQAAAEAGCGEAILIAENGDVTEGTHTSLFGVKGGKLLTSPRGPHILPGITRGFVFQLAERVDVPVSEEPLRAETLRQIDELFLCGTSTEVMPITRVDDWQVGTGRPGAITQRMHAAFREAVGEWLGGELRVEG
ncbi:MAG: aminotransferase class IV [Planctomycetales bacterium]